MGNVAGPVERPAAALDDLQGPGESKPRILVLTSTLPAVPGDGTPEFVLTLARSLADRYDITILAPRTPGSRRSEQADGVHIVRFPYFPRRWEGLAQGAIVANLKARPARWLEVPPLMGAFAWHARRLAQRIRPAAVHAHWIVPGGLIALMLRRRAGIPYVLTIHGADAYALRGAAVSRVKRAVVRGAAVVSAVSTDITRRLDLGAHGEDRVVPMGVDADAIQDGVGERTPKPARFLFVGRLAEKKGVDVLIRALAAVPKASVAVAGDGPDRRALEDLSQALGVADRIAFLGTLPKKRVLEELRSAQALVIPSKVAAGGDQEGTPVVLAEGMAAGVPVIASSLGGLAEHVVDGRSGILTEPGSVSSLTDAIRQAIDDPQTLTRYGEEGARAVRQRLDISVTSSAYTSFLDEAIGSS